MLGDRQSIDMLIGQTLKSIVVSEDNREIKFTTKNGKRYTMYHDQDCCESVTIDEIIGDLDDLLNSPILDARVETNSSDEPKKDSDNSFTWTFYIISTIKGTVTLRWFGASNGYYSEEVTFREIK